MRSMCSKLGNNKAIPRQSTGMGMGISLDQSEPRGGLCRAYPDDFYELLTLAESSEALQLTTLCSSYGHVFGQGFVRQRGRRQSPVYLRSHGLMHCCFSALQMYPADPIQPCSSRSPPTKGWEHPVLPRRTTIVRQIVAVRFFIAEF